MQKHDHVRILFDSAGIAQIGENRPLITPLRARAGELRQRDERNVSEVIGYQGQRADLGRRAEQQRTVQRVERPVPAQTPAVKAGIEKQDRQHGGERELKAYVGQIARPDGQHQRRRAEHDVVAVAADRGTERRLRGRQHQGRADDRRRQSGHNGIGP